MMVSWRPDFFLIRSKRKVYILKKKVPERKTGMCTKYWLSKCCVNRLTDRALNALNSVEGA